MRALLPLLMLLAGAAAPGGFTIGGQSFAPADIIDARAIPDLDGHASIMLTFAPAAAARLKALTAAQAGKPLAVALDGAVIVQPVVDAPIDGGVMQMSGAFAMPEATALAKRISGKDPLPESLDQ